MPSTLVTVGAAPSTRTLANSRGVGANVRPALFPPTSRIVAPFRLIGELTLGYFLADGVRIGTEGLVPNLVGKSINMTYRARVNIYTASQSVRPPITSACRTAASMSGRATPRPCHRRST